MEYLSASANAAPSTLVFVKKKTPAELSFNDRLVSLRKERVLTQQAVADMVAMHISHIRRCESGRSQPTLDAIRTLAVALSVSADSSPHHGGKRAALVVAPRGRQVRML